MRSQESRRGGTPGSPRGGVSTTPANLTSRPVPSLGSSFATAYYFSEPLETVHEREHERKEGLKQPTTALEAFDGRARRGQLYL